MVITQNTDPVAVSHARPLGPDTLPLVGGSLCLDFANTMDWRGTERERDWLGTYDDLVAWCAYAGALEPRLAKRLRARARTRPGNAHAVLRRARTLREAIFALGSAAARGRRPAEAALGAFNREVFGLLGRTRLNTALTPAWAGPRDAPEQALWPLAWSAFELFRTGPLDRVRECAGADCRWLFLDQSRNRSRRWCDMGNCGNLEKARRYRARHR